MVQKAVNAEAKTGLKSSIMVQNTDFCCFRGHHLFQNTSAKVQTQGLTTKEFKPEKSKPKNLKLANRKTSILPHINKPKKLFTKIRRKSILKRSGTRKTLL